MREQKSVYHMTDRELRAYRRQQRRQRETRKRILSFLATLFLITACVIFHYHSVTTSASAGEEEVFFKYYTRITVRHNDTLWEIADDYIDYRQYDSKQNYIKEVCSINHLEDADELVAGQTIVVPYYSMNYVK